MWWLLGFLGIGYVALHLVVRSHLPASPFVIGHRGAAGLAPENTLAAIYTGLRAGASVIEIDVHTTLDGVVVVHHDQTVTRTTNGTGRIDEYHWEELQKLDAGSHFSHRFEGEKVPSLESVLRIMAESGAVLVIEVKYPADNPGIEQKVVDLLSDFKLDAIIISFDLVWLKRFGEAYPYIPIGQLMKTAHPRVDIPTTYTVSIDWHALLYKPFFVRNMHQRGWQVWVWTVDNPWIMRLMVWLGVDGITTNRPDIGCKVVK